MNQNKKNRNTRHGRAVAARLALTLVGIFALAAQALAPAVYGSENPSAGNPQGGAMGRLQPKAQKPGANLLKLKAGDKRLSLKFTLFTITSFDAKTGQVTSVEKKLARKVEAKRERTFKFTSDPKMGLTFRVGQSVFVEIGTKSAMVTAFPIRGSRKNEVLPNMYMETSVIISDDNRIDGVTRTWSRNILRGFTGGVVVAITDKDRNVLFTTKLRTYGVNSMNLPGESDRTSSWSEAVPSDVLNAAAGYAIYHTHEPKMDWQKFLGIVRDFAKRAAEIYLWWISRGMLGEPPGESVVFAGRLVEQG